MSPFRLSWVIYAAGPVALLGLGSSAPAARLAIMLGAGIVAATVIGAGWWRSRILVTDRRVAVRSPFRGWREARWSDLRSVTRIGAAVVLEAPGGDLRTGPTMDARRLLQLVRDRRPDLPVIELASST
ncbi:MAG TPA: hypothetical protein VE777_18185 [Gaiellales bacterium]|nr:hypothetical protein [Gaiellales bacterium]